MAERAGGAQATAEPIGELIERLGHRFARPGLVRTALTHASTGDASYERLEFLGDRVLGLIVADLLMAHFPDEAEGALARRHAALVRRETLAAVGRQLGLAAHLRLARGEAEGGGRDNPAILADVCEALIAALYLDGGLEAARRFVEPLWRPLLESADRPPQDAKTALQEWAQARSRPLPAYEVVERSGPDHDPLFTVRVSVEDEAPETATGRSKRLAEQAAAERLLERLRGTAP